MKNNIRVVLTFIVSGLAILFTGCDSAEAIEQYSYSTTKVNLEKAVNNVLQNNRNPNVIWDTASYLVVRRFRDEYKDKPWFTTAMDTIRPSKYNGGFYWITIKEKNIKYNYGFTYLGGENEWATSSNSTICLDQLWNNKGLDLRQGENVGDFSSKEANAAKALFEKNFLNNLDKEVNLKHSTGRSFWQ